MLSVIAALRPFAAAVYLTTAVAIQRSSLVRPTFSPRVSGSETKMVCIFMTAK